METFTHIALRFISLILKNAIVIIVSLAALTSILSSIYLSMQPEPPDENRVYRCNNRHERWLLNIDTHMRSHAYDGMKDCQTAQIPQKEKYFRDYLNNAKPCEKTTAYINNPAYII